MKLLGFLTLLLAAGTATGVTIFQRTRPYEVTAYVVSAAQVVPGNDVVMGGVPVGHVSAVGLAPDGGPAGAQITMQLDQRYAPLHHGTRVTLRPKGLLGNMFVELTPSGAGGTIASGGTIPVQDTASPVTLDQVTDIFDAQTRQALQTLNQQGAVALQNRGPDVNHVLQRLPQVSSDLAQTAGALDDQDQELNALAIEFDRVASQVSGEDKSLRGDVANGATLLDTLAAHQQHLQDELSAANSSLGNLNTALDGHQASLNQLLKDQPALLQQLQEFEASSTTTFGTIDPCVNDLFNTLGEMRSATDYSHPAGSTDGNGFMLRVDPQLVGATNGTLTPTARCSG
ncbi:MAG: MCE family protein [Chloroflexi bacterium]|nr:MAG: MCE family protein [Chloroflexota bacterium]